MGYCRALDSPPVDDTPTTLLPAVPEPPPVFVDPSGQRRRRLRRIAYAVGLAGLAYTAMVGVSFAGTPVSPETVLPYVEPTQQPWQPPPPGGTAPGASAPTAATGGSPAGSALPAARTSTTPTRPTATAAVETADPAQISG